MDRRAGDKTTTGDVYVCVCVYVCANHMSGGGAHEEKGGKTHTAAKIIRRRWRVLNTSVRFCTPPPHSASALRQLIASVNTCTIPRLAAAAIPRSYHIQ